jgi:hypothetical protein
VAEDFIEAEEGLRKVDQVEVTSQEIIFQDRQIML